MSRESIAVIPVDHTTREIVFVKYLAPKAVAYGNAPATDAGRKFCVGIQSILHDVYANSVQYKELIATTDALARDRKETLEPLPLAVMLHTIDEVDTLQDAKARVAAPVCIKTFIKACSLSTYLNPFVNFFEPHVDNRQLFKVLIIITTAKRLPNNALGLFMNARLGHGYPDWDLKSDTNDNDELVVFGAIYDEHVHKTVSPLPSDCDRKMVMQPFISATDMHSVASDGRFVCNACHVPEHTKDQYRLCGNCKLVKYCSKQCQRSDWSDHKSRCKAS